MQEHEHLVLRCRQRIELLNQREDWGLSEAQIDTYVTQLVEQVPPRSLELRLEQVIHYFHADHRLFTALRDEQKPEHGVAWAWAEREITRVMQHQGLAWSRDRAVETGDLVQTVQAELVRALVDYRFESRLRTWLHSVTVQRLRRFHRDSLAAKRALRLAPLEEADALPTEWHTFEHEILARVLVEDIKRVLHATGDERYARIFLLRQIDDHSAEEIGERIQLHASRVRVLLNVARELLQSDTELSSWAEDTMLNERTPDQPGAGKQQNNQGQPLTRKTP